MIHRDSKAVDNNADDGSIIIHSQPYLSVSVSICIVSYRIFPSLFTCRSDLVLRLLVFPPFTPTGMATPSLDGGTNN